MRRPGLFLTRRPRLQILTSSSVLAPWCHAIISTRHDASANHVFDSEFCCKQRPRGSIHRFIRKTARARFHHAGNKGGTRSGGLGWPGPRIRRNENGREGEPDPPTPEDAIHLEKRRKLARMARQFLRARCLENTPWKFDVLAIETSLEKTPNGAPAQIRIRRTHRLTHPTSPCFPPAHVLVLERRKSLPRPLCLLGIVENNSLRTGTIPDLPRE